MTQYFDGKMQAKKREEKLVGEFNKLRIRGVKPKLISILVGDDPSSKLYLKLKRLAAKRVGVKLEITKFSENVSMIRITDTIYKLNPDETVHGIMVQLSLPKRFSKSDRKKIIDSIDPKKDVDGMRDGSPYVAPVVQAVLTALTEALRVVPLRDSLLKVAVVGHKGFEGRKIYRKLRDRDLSRNYSVVGADVETKDLRLKTLDADVIISATGMPNLIKAGMVKQGVVLIDVGSPKGDIDESAYKKASFVSPVPGGIGPLTVICLLKNLVESSKKV